MKARLHVIMARAGIASRRKSEELITAGNVQVNGKTVKELGILADPEVDTIVVNGKKLKASEGQINFLMNKPRGVVSTVSDPDGKRTVIDLFTKFWQKQSETPMPRVYPVGRLDEESEGLMMLTNDGDLAYRMTHPKFEVKKIYEVMVKGNPTNTQLSDLQKGIKLKEGRSQIDDARVSRHESGNTWLTIAIHQGMHHQVRRTLAKVGLEVTRLIRVKMGEFELGNLKTGEIKKIEI